MYIQIQKKYKYNKDKYTLQSPGFEEHSVMFSPQILRFLGTSENYSWLVFNICQFSFWYRRVDMILSKVWHLKMYPEPIFFPMGKYIGSGQKRQKSAQKWPRRIFWWLHNKLLLLLQLLHLLRR